MALTANDPDYQPGFEDADTSLQAAVPIYGVYDFTSRLGTNRLPFWYRRLESPDHEGVPRGRAREVPPRLAHRAAPPQSAALLHRFTATATRSPRLKRPATSPTSCARHRSQPVIYAELGGAQHAFDLFCSPRTSHMLVGGPEIPRRHPRKRPTMPSEELADDGVGYLGVAVP